jgi:hypothetical protein
MNEIRTVFVCGQLGRMDELWLPTLRTDTPQQGIELAVKLSRLGMMLSQVSEEISQASWSSKNFTPAESIAAAHVIAVNFQTIAIANEWWRQLRTRARSR